MSPDWKGLLRSVGLTHAHQQSEEAVRAEEALQAARSAAAPPPPPQPPQPLHQPPPPPPTTQTGLHVLWDGGFGDDGPERRRKCVVRAERANPALRYVERKGKRPPEAAATAPVPAVVSTATTHHHFPSVAALGGRKGPMKTQAASAVEPWVPAAANVRDGQVAALYSGLAKCEGGKAVLAAAGLLPMPPARP